MRAALRVGLLGVVWGLLPRTAQANERHFTFTYETATLPPGARELEVWMTPRVGREDRYAKFENRLEFEWGLTPKLMTAFYLNGWWATEEVGGQLVSSSAFAGFSSEWKYKLLDPVADAVGFALYGEVSATPNEVELEGKLLFDKRMGNVLLALNVVGEQEFEFELAETEPEWKVEVDLAFAYFLTERLSLGVELRNVNEVVEHDGWEYSATYAGPVVAYASQNWWVAFTFLPQLPGLNRGSEGGGSFVLEDEERVNARFLLAWHL